MSIRRPTLSHGPDGSEIKTKDGITLVGKVLSEGDPVIVKCLGGQTRTIARSRVAGIRKMEKSLMFTPAMLGLSALSVADIAAYLDCGGGMGRPPAAERDRIRDAALDRLVRDVGRDASRSLSARIGSVDSSGPLGFLETRYRWTRSREFWRKPVRAGAR